jgi:hypothetical protein
MHLLSDSPDLPHDNHNRDRHDPLAGVSALWGPLAFAIMFGLAFAMILTLVLIPYSSTAIQESDSDISNKNQ